MNAAAAAAAAFDRELTLADLVRGLPLARVVSALEMLTGTPVGIEDLGGRIVAGHAMPEGEGEGEAIPVRLEIEPLCQLRLPRGRLQQGAAATVLLELLLHARAQVVRAGDLHAAAMGSEYDELRRRNEALQASQARYRELAQTLEARVQAQVAELDQRQRQIYLAERLASIGQLAAGIAHEINNPIGFILSNLESGRRYLPQLQQFKAALPAGSELAVLWQQLDLGYIVDDLGELLSDSIAGATRIARIVRDLKGFSGVDRPDPEDVDLNAQLATVVALVGAARPDGAPVVQSYAEGLPRLLCLPGHLNQVFVNLLNNALQAVQGQADGRVEVSTRGDDANLWVEIADNGVGIAPDVLPRVFDPFFTTRGVGRGVGLGLTVARDIVAAHDGSVQLRSAPGLGTTASVRLPLTPP
ncbi:Putative histidine kinase [Rubrivivax sp. A210]|uniref:sensor histidine kinase n=1 Tax=Rubrivivax sp. A210 TaxID=2772301 RepID=UPI001917A98C|nr:ATP-binding protein [Rubrivivax sp. A210]CAD5374364.1 Putative histidine kinase [Rubrivivax sp. A210]